MSTSLVSHEDIAPLSNFLKGYAAYDVMPDSAKVIIVDDTFSMARALVIMSENATTSCTLWNTAMACYSGVVTSTDIMGCWLSVRNGYSDKYKKVCDTNTLLHLLDLIRIKDWKYLRFEYKVGHAPGIEETLNAKPCTFYHANPETSLFDSIRFMFQHHIHRLPVVNNYGSLTHVLTFRSICRYLVSKFRLPAEILKKEVVSLGLGEKNIATVYTDTSVEAAVAKLIAMKLSAMPVLEAGSNRVVNIFSKTDFIVLARDDHIDFNCTVDHLLVNRPADVEPLHTLNLDATLGQVLKLIAESRVHRIVLIDENGELYSVVSLRHILGFLAQSKEDEVDLLSSEGTEEE